MVTVALLLAVVAMIGLVILFGALMAPVRRRRLARRQVALGSLLTEPLVPDLAAATGRYDGLPVALRWEGARIHAAVTLPPSVLSYTEIVERFASDSLVARLAASKVTIDRRDRLSFAVSSGGDARAFVALEGHLRLAAEVRDLRRFVPSELIARLAAARGAAELDELLDALCRHFPESPEVADAFALAMQRDGSPEIAARAAAWRSHGPIR